MLLTLCFSIGLGKLCAQTGDTQLYYKDSLDFYKTNDHLINYLKVLDDLHNFYLKSKDFESLKLLSEYYTLFRKPNNNEEQEKARFSYTLYAFTFYNKLGDNINALKFYELAHENLNNKLIGDKLSWYIENVIGNIYTRLEEYEKAEYYFNIVERYLKSSGNDRNLTRLYINKSRSLNSQGKTSIAISVLNDAKKLTRDEKALAGLYLNLVDMMLLDNKIDSCQMYLDSFNNLSSQIRDERLYYYFELLGDKNIKEGKFDEGQRAYDESYSLLVTKLGTSNTRECAKLLNKKSKAFLTERKFGEAESNLKEGYYALNESYDTANQTLPKINQIYPENTFFELTFQYAILAFEKYITNNSIEDLYIAQSAVDLGLYTNRMLGYSYFTTPSKMVSIKQNKLIVDLGLDILYALYEQEGSERWHVKVNEMFDFSKSLSLVDKLSKNKQLSSMHLNAKDSLLNLQNILSQLYVEKSNVNDEILIDSLAGLIFSTEDQIKSIYGAVENDFDYDQSTLPAFVEYVITSTSVYSLNNLKGELEFRKNGSLNDFNKLHSEFNSYIINKEELTNGGILSKMYNYLLGDMDLRKSKITIIPDGLISTIPFDILVGKNAKYLIFNHSLFYTLHKMQLSDIRARSVLKKLYTLQPNYESMQSASIERGGKYRLEFANIEIQNIKELFPDAFYTSNTIDKDSIIKELKTAGAFHFSGHAVADKDEAFLMLSSSENDLLSYLNISDQTYDLELVVLSACETGLGQLAYGDGLQSLSRAFIQAGSKTVINSLWTVNDRSTAMISSNFYRLIKKGESIDDALRGAKLQYLSESPIEAQHPYYWAGFIGVGNCLPLEVIQSPYINWYWTLIITLFILLIGGLYLIKK